MGFYNSMTNEELAAAYSGAKKILKDRSKGVVSTSMNGTNQQKYTTAAAEFVGNSLGLILDGIAKGKIGKADVAVAVVKQAGEFAKIPESDRMKCVGAMLGWGADVGSVAVQGAALAGTATYGEAVTLGAITPAVAIQTTLFVSSSIGAFNSGVKAMQQCGPVAVRDYHTLSDSFGEIVRQGEEALGQAVQDLTNAIESTVSSGAM